MSEANEVPINSMYGNLTSSLFMSTLRLFNGVPVKTQKTKIPSQKLVADTIDYGFIFSPQLVGNYQEKELRGMIVDIATEVGLTPTQMNKSFHKSWKKVRDAPYGQLLAEQIYHYMTTYGFEAMGTYSENTVFIPNERLDIPEVTDGVKLSVIKGYTMKQLREKLLKLLNSGMAMDNIGDIIAIALEVKLTTDEVINLKNKEVRVRLYNHLDLIPEDPVELLRLAVFEATEKTLLITNVATVKAIQEEGVKGNKEAKKLFEQYDEHFGYKRLAEIFLRFKRVFLAFKVHDGMSAPINKIGHLSDKYHKRMPQSMLNNITAMLKKGDPIYESVLNDKLKHVNIWRKIRLAQSLKYRMTGNKSIMYKIRNGKAFATTMDFTKTKDAESVYDIILASIAKDLKHLKGKEIYIPENMTYALPATAKQFTGNIPSGSYITVGKDMIFGVYWENQGRNRIDLDLHGLALNAGHIGWNAQYRSGNGSVLFTGDITDAPSGATELYYINKDYDDVILLTLNYYNFDKDIPVPFKIIVGEEHPNSFGSNYTINPNNVKSIVPSVIDVQQKVIGLGTVKDGECRFYFNETALGNSIAVRGGDYVNIARDYLAKFATTQITLNEVLKIVGAKIVTKQTTKSIDLSPENLEKDTFINLLIKQ